MLGLVLYGIFALTTAIMATVYLLAPVINQQPGPVENKFLLYSVFFMMSIITAPVVFYSTISWSTAEVFKEHLAKGLFEKP